MNDSIESIFLLDICDILSPKLYCMNMLIIFLKRRTLLFISVLVLLSSCQARIDGAVKEGGAADLTLKAALGPRTTALIRSLRLFLGEGADAPILDGSAIGRSMALAPGMRSVTLRNNDLHALEGSISISNVGDFLDLGAEKSRFITFTEGHETSSLILTLNRDSAPELISRLSPEVAEYLSALMAPVLLGETMTRKEYLDLVASIYGQPVAGEIADSRIHGSIEFPRQVKAIQGGRASGRQAEFDIPLLDILVLESALRYEVSW